MLNKTIIYLQLHPPGYRQLAMRNLFLITCLSLVGVLAQVEALTLFLQEWTLEEGMDLSLAVSDQVSLVNSDTQEETLRISLNQPSTLSVIANEESVAILWRNGFVYELSELQFQAQEDDVILIVHSNDSREECISALKKEIVQHSDYNLIHLVEMVHPNCLNASVAIVHVAEQKDLPKTQ